MRRNIALLAVLLTFTLGSAWAQTPTACGTAGAVSDPRLADVDELITAAMDEWKVPGLAIAVVADDEVVLCSGYGYRDLDEKAPVTPRTLFAIGSITKSFTVTALAMLAAEGRLEWDEPVREYLPDFQLYDDVATQRITPRDLVTHRSGLPRHDMVWYAAGRDRRDLYERMRYLEPSADIRETFQYQNLMFMTAGYLAGQLAGTSWEALVRERIFEPLGMERSNFSVRTSQMTDDFAYPYARSGELFSDGETASGEARQIDFRELDGIGPAGSINSSVEEMIAYVRLHLDGGEYQGERLLPAEAAAAMQAPQMVTQISSEYDELGHTSYGMGFFVTTYRGHTLVHHGGGIDGFISFLSFMPGRGLGMIVLSNQSSDNVVPIVVTRAIYDRLLGVEPADWAGRAREARRKAHEAAKEREAEEIRAEGTQPSHALADYVGDYEHPGYGVIRVDQNGDGLAAEFNGESVVLEHYHYDVFEAREDERAFLGGIKVMFLYNKAGVVDRLAVPLEPALDDIVFTRRMEEAPSEATSLREGRTRPPPLGVKQR